MASTSNASPVVVDVHTHMYPPSYISLLTSRTSVPVVRTYPRSATDAPETPRLILLNTEADDIPDPETHTGPPPGRPLTEGYTSVAAKLAFMDRHRIDVSVLSLANPWLDFVEPANAAQVARDINDEFEAMCTAHPGRLYFFAALPLTASVKDILEAIRHCATLAHCRGVIMGTSGLGQGLDDEALMPVFEAISSTLSPAVASRQAKADSSDSEDHPHPFTIFLHPHYGLPAEVYGPHAASGKYGHVLPLAIGFPVETTIAVTRMYLAGVFERFHWLRFILAHSGGTLPFLAGRIESCVVHDALLGPVFGTKNPEGPEQGHVTDKTSTTNKIARKTIWDVLQTHVFLDAVAYSPVALRAAIAASDGAERLMFGTDHPFFPPIDKADAAKPWESVEMNARALKALTAAEEKMVLGENAVRILGLCEVDTSHRA